MATKYPNGIDDNISLPQAIDLVTPVNGAAVNTLRDAIIAIEAELGIDPSREYGTVRARLDALENGGSAFKSVKKDNITIVEPVGSINFIGDVDVTNAGNGEANVEINTTLFEEIEGEVTTSNNTPTVIATYNIPTDNSVVNIHVMINARDEVTGDSGVWVLSGGFERTGATTLQLGDTAILNQEKEYVNYDVDFNVSLNTIQVIVTGHPANNTNWKAIAQIVEIS